MKLLIDQGLPRVTARLLQEHGIDAVHVGDIGMSTASDTDILQKAIDGDQVVVTLDADFHALLAVNQMSFPSVIRIRIEGLKGPSLFDIILKVMNVCKSDLAKGAAISVHADRVGVRLLPISK